MYIVGRSVQGFLKGDGFNHSGLGGLGFRV